MVENVISVLNKKVKVKHIEMKVLTVLVSFLTLSSGFNNGKLNKSRSFEGKSSQKVQLKSSDGISEADIG